MNEAQIQELFATLETEQLIEKLQESKDNQEVKELVKHQLGQEFIKLLAISESMEIDFEDAINVAVGELEMAHNGCEDEDCEDDDCCSSGCC